MNESVTMIRTPTLIGPVILSGWCRKFSTNRFPPFSVEPIRPVTPPTDVFVCLLSIELPEVEGLVNQEAAVEFRGVSAVHSLKAPISPVPEENSATVDSRARYIDVSLIDTTEGIGD